MRVHWTSELSEVSGEYIFSEIADNRIRSNSNANHLKICDEFYH